MTMKSKYLKMAVVGLTAIMTLNSCRESIDEGARFTFVGNTVATYLQGEADCSHFVEILTRGECIGLMKAYGTYTCFAPTNKAVERFLFEQDSIYWASVKANAADPKVRIVETGVHSPHLRDLSAEKCAEISRNHIIPKVYLGINLKGNIIPDANINDRDLTLEFVLVDDKSYPVINKQARVIREEEVENGVVHVVEGVVNPSSLDVATLLSDYDYFDLFFEALSRTGYADMLTEDEDDTYTEGDKYAKSMNESSLVPYPAAKRLGYTIFLETNDVLERYGVRDWEDLDSACRVWYPEVDKDGKKTQVWAYDEENNEWKEDFIDWEAPLTSPCNHINQFVGYHLLDRKLSYEYLVFHNVTAGSSYNSEDDFPGNADRTEYYVTMNNRILKVTKPLRENNTTIYLNYAPEGRGQNIKVYRPNEFVKLDEQRYGKYNQEALNGSLNVIDDVLTYDETIMAGQVLNCIMRFDMAAICSELTNNRIRWKYLHNLTAQADVFIPHDYCKNVEVFSENTRLFYLPPHSNWSDYQGDEMMAKGVFDLAYRLPPVPEGTYEIRLGYSANELRGIVQVYLDNEVTGIPINLTLLGDNPKINWQADDEKDEDKNLAIDKDMKNRGFLKGPKSFYSYSKPTLAREDKSTLRAVIATKHLTAGAHWLRFKDVNQQGGGKGEFMHDYIEIVPMDYLRSLDVPEDEKRY